MDYTPKNLTNWGYNEVQYDLNIDQGCVFYKLMLRAFPNHFKCDSVYAHYPMTTPSAMEGVLKTLGRHSDYSYEKPTRIPARINITTYQNAKYVLERGQEFTVMWNEGFENAMGRASLNFMLAGDSTFHAKQREVMAKAIYRDEWHKSIKNFYEWQTAKLLKEKSCKIAGTNQVDITRE